MQATQVRFNPSLAVLAFNAEEKISQYKIDLQGQETRWHDPAVFNQVYGKMLVDEILAMLQELIWQYDADERYLSGQAVETARQIIRNRFE